MTLTLTLMRHTKSNWDDPAQEDFERPLSPRGQAAAPLLGKWLQAKGYKPDLALVSTAQRAQETWALVAGELSKDVELTLTRDLYLASPDVIRRVLQGNQAKSIVLVAHNPGLAELAARLVKTPPSHPKFQQYPTGATSVIDFDTDDWANLGWRAGTLRDFTVPRDLA